MKRLIIALVIFFVLASVGFTENTITVEVETNDFSAYTDTTELYLEYEVSEDTIAGFIVTVDDLIFDDPVVLTIEGVLDFTLEEESTAQLGAGIEVFTNEIYVKGNVLNYKISDDVDFNAKAKYNIGTDYYAVANLVYTGDETEFIIEGRTDSDGGEFYSAEAQLTFALSDDVDFTLGYEMNDWDDDINDWDEMAIIDGTDTAYGKIVIKF